jgi:hypothetical protein
MPRQALTTDRPSRGGPARVAQRPALGGVDRLTTPYNNEPVASAEVYRNSYHNGKCDLAQELIVLPITDLTALLTKWAATPRKARGTGPTGGPRRREPQEARSLRA